MNKKVTEAIDSLGGVTSVARLCGVRPHFVCYSHPSHDTYYVLDTLGIAATFLAGAVTGWASVVIGTLLSCLVLA